MSYACLWYYIQNKEIKDIDKLLNYSLNDYYNNIENNIYISSNKEDRIRKISDAFELCYEVDKTIKNRNECDMLKINKSNELREKIIKVNEYKKEEF